MTSRVPAAHLIDRLLARALGDISRYDSAARPRPRRLARLGRSVPDQAAHLAPLPPQRLAALFLGSVGYLTQPGDATARLTAGAAPTAGEEALLAFVDNLPTGHGPADTQTLAWVAVALAEAGWTLTDLHAWRATRTSRLDD